MRATTHGAAALLFALCTILLAAPRPAQAETVSTCVGYIDSVPATITTQGTWCMRKDLSTAITGGAAITVAANNVIIDCNDFKLGGLAAGPDTEAAGVLMVNRINVRVRNCAVRGFRFGVLMYGAGLSVADSRFDNNTVRAITVAGEGLEILRNTVRDTGGGEADAIGILADGDGLVRDNHVYGVHGTGDTGDAHGILARMEKGTIADNTVTGVQGGSGTGPSFGIVNSRFPTNVVIVGNSVSFSPEQSGGGGILCYGGVAARNVVNGHLGGIPNCIDGGGNYPGL